MGASHYRGPTSHARTGRRTGGESCPSCLDDGPREVLAALDTPGGGSPDLPWGGSPGGRDLLASATGPGVIELLLKPYDIGQFLSAVKEALTTRASARPHGRSLGDGKDSSSLPS